VSGAYWVHELHVLMWAYQHIHGVRALFRFYEHHHAVGLLRSGITSETPGSWWQAVRLLWWLVTRHIGPVDW
jgi:hypothetical protein